MGGWIGGFLKRRLNGRSIEEVGWCEEGGVMGVGKMRGMGMGVDVK